MPLFRISTYTNPTKFMRWSGALLPFLGAATVTLLAVGLYLALIGSPADYQQGEAVRMMYVHVPAAWMASFVYVVVAVASAVALIWRDPLADIAAQAAAPLGAGFTFVCLVAGSLWGKPMWGTWWVWDARLTSVLVLFFLYLGYLALVNAFDDPQRGARAGAILALVGAVDLPIIKFSVDWWNTLHQPASVLRMNGPTMSGSMLLPLLIMGLAFTLLFVTLLLVKMRTALMAAKLRALRMAEIARDERASSGATTGTLGTAAR
jgi:heme exporter protein C